MEIESEMPICSNVTFVQINQLIPELDGELRLVEPTLSSRPLILTRYTQNIKFLLSCVNKDR